MERGTQRYEVLYRADENALTRAIVELGSECGRYGYRRITVKLREAGDSLLCRLLVPMAESIDV